MERLRRLIHHLGVPRWIHQPWHVRTCDSEVGLVDSLPVELLPYILACGQLSAEDLVACAAVCTTFISGGGRAMFCRKKAKVMCQKERSSPATSKSSRCSTDIRA